MKFSKRVSQWTTHSNALSAELSRRRESGQPVLDLTESNSTKCFFRYLAPGILKPLEATGNLFYEPDSHGLLEARKAVCGYYADKGILLDPRQIFITASTSEAYSFLFRLLLNVGDEILVPKPSYPLFDYLAGLNDAAVAHYGLVYRNQWRIDAGNFERQIQKGVKTLIILNPNNPTGNFISPQERAMINNLCVEHGLPVISDEVFLDFVLDGKNVKPQSFAGNDPVLSFTLSGISKILGLPQMKLSWIVVNGPKNSREKAIKRLEVIADAYLSVGTPPQRALKTWFGLRGKIHGEMLERFSKNRKHLTEKISELKNAEVLTCEGGWNSILRVKSHLDDEKLALSLLKEQGVLVHPGYFFDFEGDSFLVLSHLLPEGEFREGADRLGLWRPS